MTLSPIPIGGLLLAALAAGIISCSPADRLPREDLLPGEPMKVWLVDGLDLHLTYQYGTPTNSTLPDMARESIRLLLRGLPDSGAAEGLTTQVPLDTQLRDVYLDQDGSAIVLVVDLSREFNSARNSQLAIAQVVFTASQFKGENRVQVEVEGKPVASDIKADWFSRMEPIVLHEPIVVDEPVAIAGTSIVVKGNALATNRQVVISLLSDEGTRTTSRSFSLSCNGRSQCRDGFKTTFRTPRCATEGVLRIELRLGKQVEATREVDLEFQQPTPCQN